MQLRIGGLCGTPINVDNSLPDLVASPHAFLPMVRNLHRAANSRIKWTLHRV